MVSENFVSFHFVPMIIFFLGILRFVAFAITGQSNGTFSSPNYEIGRYPPDLQCIYTFVAKTNFRVKLFFQTFALPGSPATCDVDYLDIYAEIPNLDINILDQELSGRYCGSLSPRIRISLHTVMVLVFHTRADSKGAKGFYGTYQFIPGNKYKVGSSKVGSCGFTIDQVYNCPYDRLTIYDGDSNRAPIIRKLCGLHQNVTILSETENLYVEFTSGNPPLAEQRGFQMDYFFSRKFVNIDKIISKETAVSHRRGTECDVRVQSRKETTHIIHSPNYPQKYPANTNCTYILDGLQGAQHLEKVRLTFQAFSIASQIGDCEDAFLAVYLSGQDWQNEPPDKKFCSTSGSFPPTLQASGARMVLVLRTGNTRDHGFKATVHFHTDFGIPGEHVEGHSNKCHFMFNSSSSSEFAYFNSPRYPSNYPLGMDCNYYLNGEAGQRVRIVFEQFTLHTGLSSNPCGDWLELIDIFPDQRTRKIGRYCANRFPGPLVSSFGASRIKVRFHSDDFGTAMGFKASYDFVPQPVLEFPKNPINGCGGEISGGRGGWLTSPYFPNTYTTDLICHWVMEVRRGYRILLKTITMNMEGSMGETVNCQNAAIRVHTKPEDPFDHEFCGKHSTVSLLSRENRLKIRSDQTEFVCRSQGRSRKLPVCGLVFSFVTSPTKVDGGASGADQGFKFVWTEIRLKNPGAACGTQAEWGCLNNKEFCIDRSLLCDGAPNCGNGDISDEAYCEEELASRFSPAIIFACSAGVCVSLLLILVIGYVIYLRKCRK